MEILENLPLVDVTYEDNETKAVLVFLDEERGEVREVNFNRNSYDSQKGEFVADPEKAAKIDEWCEKHFSLPFEKLSEAIGEERTVYAYDTFNALEEFDIVEKFSKDDVGTIMEVEVKDAFDDGIKIAIRFDVDGKTYESKMTYADYLEAKKQWFVNPQKRTKQYDKFEEKFHIPVTDIDKLIGEKVMVEVKLAFKKFVYAEIKPMKKK